MNLNALDLMQLFLSCRANLSPYATRYATAVQTNGVVSQCKTHENSLAAMSAISGDAFLSYFEKNSS